jgi:hypothetical protein
MMKKNMFRATIMLLFLLPIESMASTQSFSETQLSSEGQAAYRTLLTAQRFEDRAIGYAGSPSKLVEAYCVLLREPLADAAFKRLQERATLPGQLYALIALYFTDPVFFRSAVEKYRNSEERVDTMFGCIVGLMPVSMLVESKKPIKIDRNHPEQSLRAHVEANRKEFAEWNSRKKKPKNDKPPAPYQLDILNGSYSVVFTCR